MSIHEDWRDDENAKPRGMSTTSKVLLTLGIVGGFFLLLCCGGVAYVIYQGQKFVQNAASDDPAKVRARTAEMIDIEVPPDFEPKGSLDFMVWKMVMYQHKTNPAATLMIAEFGSQFGGNQEQQRKQMLDAFRQRSPQPGPVGTGNATIETREIEIDGQKVPFQFVLWKEGPDGKGQRQISGAVPSKTGVAMVMLVSPEDVLDDDQIEALLSSIHVPGKAPQAKKASPEKPLLEKLDD